MFKKLYESEYDRTKELVKEPDWYLELNKVRQARLIGLGAVQAAFSGNVAEAVAYAKHQMLDVFEQLLSENSVRIGVPGKDELDNQDEDREPISQVVVHHSARAEGLSLSTLSAMHLLRLYVPVYQSKSNPVLNSKGEHQPIYSGHFNEAGEQVFYGYHWKVNQNGEAIRLLDDSALAWHAGDWEVNKRSVAICIDDDLEHKSPTQDSLNSVADIIRNNYSFMPVNNDTLIGHSEVSSSACPGDQFIHGWKNKLLQRASS
jgi:hypothetical protein